MLYIQFGCPSTDRTILAVMSPSKRQNLRHLHKGYELTQNLTDCMEAAKQSPSLLSIKDSGQCQEAVRNMNKHALADERNRKTKED